MSTKKVTRRKENARKPASARVAGKKATAWAEVRRFTPAYKQLALHDRGGK